MSRIKVLFISSWFPNKLEPTNGNFVQRHAEAVSLLNDVEILHAIGDFNQQENFIFDDRTVNGIRTLTVYYKNTNNPVVNFTRRMLAYKKGFSLMNKPDLVHANVLHNNMFFAVYLKKKFSIPFVVTEHWTALRKINENITSKSVKFTAKIIGNQASKILPVSKDLEAGLKNIGITTPMKVIPNVVNTKLFSPKETPNSEFTFIHVSNLIPRKNAEKILRVALKLLNQGFRFKLKIGGDGNIELLKNLSENSSFSDRIEIFPIQPIEKIAEMMKQSDCFILFSDDENQPCVIAEAFSSGIQVISTKVGGIAEFFPKNFGILLNEPDENLLEEAMKGILKNTEVPAANEFVAYAEKTFAQQAIAQQFTEVYREVLQK